MFIFAYSLFFDEKANLINLLVCCLCCVFHYARFKNSASSVEEGEGALTKEEDEAYL